MPRKIRIDIVPWSRSVVKHK